MKLSTRLIEGKSFRSVHRRCSQLIYRVMDVVPRYLDIATSTIARKRLVAKTPINDRAVLLAAFQGDYTCNPRAIADELLRRNGEKPDSEKLTIYWHIRREADRESLPEGLTPVRRGTEEFFRAAAESKVLVENAHSFARLRVPKRKDQYLLQTWHGSLGIKRLDADGIKGREWSSLERYATKNTDYCITNSSFEEEVFATSYWGGVPTLPLGHARNDILFVESEEDKKRHKTINKRVRKRFDLDKDVKIALYAPTHKDRDESLYDLDYELLKNTLEERFGGEWIIMLRFHSRLKKMSKKWARDLPPFVINATRYPDMQELLIASNVGITDFSSWIFDYLLLDRPGFILADHLETFAQKRSFYYPLEETPFPIALDNEGLSECIRDFDWDLYGKERAQFLEERGCFEDGHASARIVDTIEDLLGK